MLPPDCPVGGVLSASIRRFGRSGCGQKSIPGRSMRPGLIAPGFIAPGFIVPGFIVGYTPERG